MRTTNTTRVILGVDGSLAGLRALRVAVAQARHHSAVLHAVRVWNFEFASAGYPAEWAREVEQEAFGVVTQAFEDAMGGEPEDVDVMLVTKNGPPGRTLTEYAHRDSDLLVVGSSRRCRLRHLVSKSVSHYCMNHATCPVLVVPADAFARAVARDGMERAIGRDLQMLTG